MKDARKHLHKKFKGILMLEYFYYSRPNVHTYTHTCTYVSNFSVFINGFGPN